MTNLTWEMTISVWDKDEVKVEDLVDPNLFWEIDEYIYIRAPYWDCFEAISEDIEKSIND